MPEQQSPQNTFVIRFWLEPTDESANERNEDGPPPAPRWRARIQHLQSDVSSYVADERQLLAFIQRYVSRFESQGNVPTLEEEDK